MKRRLAEALFTPLTQFPHDLAHLSESVPKTEAVPFEVECRQLLSSDSVDHRDLTRIIQEIHQLGLMSEEWKKLLELAYEHIPANKRIYARDAMVFLYCELGEFEKAAAFLPAKPYTVFEIVMSLEIFERLKRMDEGKAVLEICREKLASPIGEDEKIVLCEAMERYSIGSG